MYKLKTSKSVAKRFKVSSDGKMLKRSSCKSHLLQKKNSKRKRKLRKTTLVKYSDQHSFNYNLPYI